MQASARRLCAEYREVASEVLQPVGLRRQTTSTPNRDGMDDLAHRPAGSPRRSRTHLPRASRVPDQPCGGGADSAERHLEVRTADRPGSSGWTHELGRPRLLEWPRSASRPPPNRPSTNEAHTVRLVGGLE